MLVGGSATGALSRSPLPSIVAPSLRASLCAYFSVLSRRRLHRARISSQCRSRLSSSLVMALNLSSRSAQALDNRSSSSRSLVSNDFLLKKIPKPPFIIVHPSLGDPPRPASLYPPIR